MIGLDTDVVVRFLVQDDAGQAAIATRLFSELTSDRPGFISSVVLAETTWVLTRRYGTDRDALGEVVERLLRATEVVVEHPEAAYRALALFRRGTSVEFADALIATTAALAGATETVSFDRRATAEGGMRLLDR